jgi:antitoxin component YwqK of YwqJK toxin-antitoxin module
MTEINYLNGKRDGVARAYNEKNKLVEKTIYKNGDKL